MKKLFLFIFLMIITFHVTLWGDFLEPLNGGTPFIIEEHGSQVLIPDGEGREYILYTQGGSVQVRRMENNGESFSDIIIEDFSLFQEIKDLTQFRRQTGTWWILFKGKKEDREDVYLLTAGGEGLSIAENPLSSNFTEGDILSFAPYYTATGGAALMVNRTGGMEINLFSLDYVPMGSLNLSDSAASDFTLLQRADLIYGFYSLPGENGKNLYYYEIFQGQLRSNILIHTGRSGTSYHPTVSPSGDVAVLFHVGGKVYALARSGNGFTPLNEDNPIAGSDSVTVAEYKVLLVNSETFIVFLTDTGLIYLNKADLTGKTPLNGGAPVSTAAHKGPLKAAFLWDLSIMILCNTVGENHLYKYKIPKGTIEDITVSVGGTTGFLDMQEPTLFLPVIISCKQGNTSWDMTIYNYDFLGGELVALITAPTTIPKLHALSAGIVNENLLIMGGYNLKYLLFPAGGENEIISGGNIIPINNTKRFSGLLLMESEGGYLLKRYTGEGG